MKAGMLVRSLAGHDKDRLYLVLRVDGPFAYVADGRHHLMASPKKKRLRHIDPLGPETELSALECDAHIRKAIKRLKAEGGCHLG